MAVLEEIDNLKIRQDSVGNAARYVNRFLDDLRKLGSLKDGVTLDNGQEISVYGDLKDSDLIPTMEVNADNKIIATALLLNGKNNVTLISRDINIRVKCDSLGLNSENYHREKAKVSRRGAYTGVSVLELSSEEINEFYSFGQIESEHDFEPNEYLVIKGGTQSALAVYKNGIIKKLTHTSERGFSCQGIKPRNKEQTFALETLLDKDIHMATLTGKAGSGKTLLATAAAVHMLDLGWYEKIIISRPVQSLSADIGFLPGDKNEKMAPWIQPIIDNLKFVFKNGEHYFDIMMEKGIIEIEALSYIRGRSLPNTVMILDEAQNISYAEAKAVITRMGEGSKLIMLGDLQQIDAPHLDSTTSGLGAVVEKFKDFHLCSHITLLKGERSALAEHAANIL
jgi:PhoH-like ATPase